MSGIRNVYVANDFFYFFVFSAKKLHLSNHATPRTAWNWFICFLLSNILCVCSLHNVIPLASKFPFSIFTAGRENTIRMETKNFTGIFSRQKRLWLEISNAYKHKNTQSSQSVRVRPPEARSAPGFCPLERFSWSLSLNAALDGSVASLFDCAKCFRRPSIVI